MGKISVVTIAKNEERYIGQFLQTVAWCDERIVVDGGSSDKTAAIAASLGAHVYTREFDSYGPQKRFALSKASGDWVLMLDTDEYVSHELRQEIQDLLRKKPPFDAYNIPYQNFFVGHKLLCKAQKYAKIRLFRKGKGTVAADPVHEEMQITGKVGNLTGKTEHHSYRTISGTLMKFTRYAKIEAPLFWGRGMRTTWKHLTLYPAHMFWSIFFEGEGYRDGIWGLGLALCFAYYEFARYWFLLVLPQSMRSDKK